mmetsp:Transcript_32100/g.84109  ORF Transcript_32100/g.84109 Transcript_32100/m.84109 type:complete len:231 (-) Transcript_32100:2477-3169(-)
MPRGSSPSRRLVRPLPRVLRGWRLPWGLRAIIVLRIGLPGRTVASGGNLARVRVMSPCTKVLSGCVSKSRSAMSRSVTSWKHPMRFHSMGGCANKASASCTPLVWSEKESCSRICCTVSLPRLASGSRSAMIPLPILTLWWSSRMAFALCAYPEDTKTSTLRDCSTYFSRSSILARSSRSKKIRKSGTISTSRVLTILIWSCPVPQTCERKVWKWRAPTAATLTSLPLPL